MCGDGMYAALSSWRSGGVQSTPPLGDSSLLVVEVCEGLPGGTTTRLCRQPSVSHVKAHAP
eukprot:7223872-Pyramimonas_sp.AAC.3